VHIECVHLKSNDLHALSQQEQESSARQLADNVSYSNNCNTAHFTVNPAVKLVCTALQTQTCLNQLN